MAQDRTRPLPSAVEPAPVRAELARGTLAGEYEIGASIASGGSGTVYAAEHRMLRRRAAVKVLHPEMARSPEAVHRFAREARTVNVIGHPNIVDVYEYGTLPDGRPYYVMEFLHGTNLDVMIREHGKLAPRDAVELLEPICSALEAAHKAGVIHRDLKASNIFVAKPGLPWRVKLLDFGVAKLLNPEPWEPELTTVEHRLGTPIAMAPEQISNQRVDARTDVYAMGVLLYYVLTGAYPFRGSSITVERLQMTEAPAPPSARAPLPPALDAIVLRCLDKDPDQRFASIEALRLALREAVAIPAAAAAEPPPRARSRWLAPLVAVAIAGAGIAAVRIVRGGEPPQAAPPPAPAPTPTPTPLPATAPAPPPVESPPPAPEPAPPPAPEAHPPPAKPHAGKPAKDHPKPHVDKPPPHGDAWGSNSPFLPIRPQAP